MRVLIFVILGLCTSWWAQAQEMRMQMPRAAQEPAKLNIYLLNPEMRFERGSSQDIVDRRPLNISLGVQFNKVSLLVEYVRFEEKSGNATTSIARQHQDVVAWMRYHLVRRSFDEANLKGLLYAGVGAGVYEEEVKTTLMDSSRTDKGSAKFMSGLSGGGELALSVTQNFSLLGGAELRSLFSAEFEPNPIWSAVVHLGFQWSLK